MDWDDVEKLAGMMDEHGLEEIEFENEEVRIRLRKPGAAGFAFAPAMAQAPAAGAASAVTSGAPAEVAAPAKGRKVTCPFVGTFYRAPSPEDDPFVKVGQMVRKGQTLCIIEAMKLMNEIEAEFDGKVLEVLIENGQAVEFGQALFVVDPS